MQCGYCTPGWLTATAALLNRVARPDDARIAAELAGNVCRCCTYPRILRAVRRAAELMEQPELLEPVPPAGSAAAGAGLRPGPPPGAEPPAPPWDQARDAAAFFEQLPDGLVTVVAEDADPAAGPGQGRWGGPARGSEQSAWVHVGADGSVTAFTGKVEAGQGTRTALGVLVAEELAVPAGLGARGDGQHRRLTLRPGHVRQPLDAVRGAPAPRGRGGRTRGAARGRGGAVRPARRGPDRRGRDRGRARRRAERRLRRAADRRPPGREGAGQRAGDPGGGLALGRPTRAGGGRRRRGHRRSSASRRTCAPTACCTAACCARPRSAPRCAAPTRPRPRRCPG